MTVSRTNLLEKIAFVLHLEHVSAWLHKKKVSRFIASVSKPLASEISPDCSINAQTNVTNEKVFVFWAQGETEMPPIVHACFESVKRMCGAGRVVLIDKNNLGEWVSLPPSLLSKMNDGVISLTHFSDILRFCLLEQYGGWWLDATVFLSSPLPAVKGLFSVKTHPDKAFVSNGRWASFIWHLPKGSPFAVYMKKFFFYWWAQPDATLPDFFLIDYCIRWFYQNCISFQKQIDALPVSNPDLYFFQSPLCETPFNEKEWQKISTRTTFFKTSHKLTRPSVPGSFRATILEQNSV